MSDLYEIESGKIASEKGQSDAVKAFGRQMVEAHSKTREKLNAFVEEEKLDLVLPDRLGKKYRRMVEALNTAKSEDFDRIYSEQQVEVYADAARLFDAYAERGDNATLKQFAANVLPTLNQRREKAETLRQ